MSKLLEILKHRTQSSEVHVRVDQVAASIGVDLTKELCYSHAPVKEAEVKGPNRIKKKKQVQNYRLGLFDREELITAMEEAEGVYTEEVSDDSSNQV